MIAVSTERGCFCYCFRKIDNVLFMLISLIMIITLFVKKGTKGANRFGDDPLQESNQ